MPVGTGGAEHERRFGLRVRFAEGLPAAISFSDDAIVHTCDPGRDHWAVHDGIGSETLPFLFVLPSRDVRFGPFLPPRLYVKPSLVGAWRYYCEDSELLPDGNVPTSWVAENAKVRAKFDQGGADWVARGLSGIAMYLHVLKEDWRVEVEDRLETWHMGEQDAMRWVEMYSRRAAYPVLEIGVESVCLSYPGVNSWYLSSLQSMTRGLVTEEGNRITVFRPREVPEREPWRRD
jgi:hypothetical protein